LTESVNITHCIIRTQTLLEYIFIEHIFMATAKSETLLAGRTGALFQQYINYYTTIATPTT